MEPVKEENILLCIHCNSSLQPADKFCANCGKLTAEIREPLPSHVFDSRAKILSLFYLVDLGACLLASNLDYFNEYSHLVWVEVFMAVWTIGFAAMNWKELSPLYSLRNINPGIVLAVTAGAIVFSLFVSFTVNWLNTSIYDATYSFYTPFIDYPFPKLIMYLSIAVYPAIFEELGYRGVVFHYIKSTTGRRNAIIISSMAFAIIHISVLSFYWLIPFALALGYLRNKYNTLWYGMILHFVFNATACTLDILNWL